MKKVKEIYVDNHSNFFDSINTNGFFLVIVDNEGGIFFHDHIFDNENDAFYFLGTVAGHIYNGGSLNPEHWRLYRYKYGSTGYLEHTEKVFVNLDHDNKNSYAFV